MEQKHLEYLSQSQVDQVSTSKGIAYAYYISKTSVWHSSIEMGK